MGWKMSNLVQTYVQKISDSWRESVEKILQTSKLLVESEERLSDIEFLELIEKLPISQSTISKLLMIGKNNVLPTKTKYLPPHWTTIYEISQMDRNEINVGIKEGFISPSSTKKEIDKFRNFFRKEMDVTDVVEETEGESYEPTLGSFSVPSNFDPNVVDEVLKDIKKIEKKWGISFKTDKTKRGMLGIRRKILSDQMEVWLKKREQKYNKLKLSFDDIQILEDSFNQLRGGLEYHPNSDGTYSINDIRNPNHPYHGWTSGNLYHYCRQNLILCRWTQMKEIDKEGYVKSLVKTHCDGDSKKRSDSKKKLQRLLTKGNEESRKWSEWGLGVIVEGEEG